MAKTPDKGKIDRDEYLDMRYMYYKLRKYFPDDLKEKGDWIMDFFHARVEIIQPAKYELQDALIEHTKRQYPQLDVAGKPYLDECIDEIALMAADFLAADLYEELKNIREGKPYYMPEKFADHVAFFCRPRIPKLENGDNYRVSKSGKITEEMIQQWVKEDNDDEIAYCNEVNGRKSAFIETVQPILFKHFKEGLDELDVDGWNRYGIVVGNAFELYSDDCRDLAGYLEDGLLDVHPGLDFHRFALKTDKEQREAYKLSGGKK